MSEVGAFVDLDLTGVWAIDPSTGRSGPATIVVRGGILESLTWLKGKAAAGIDDHGVVVAPGFIDIHAHIREPGNTAAETLESGLDAAAHGGFTAVCAMPNTNPPIDRATQAAALETRWVELGHPVDLYLYGAITAGRAGEQLAPMAELWGVDVVAFSDDGSPVRQPELFRNALTYAGMIGLAVVEHPEDLEMTAGAEAHDGLIATVLGLKGWPASAEAGAAARDVAILADVLRDAPDAHLHLTHLSTAGSIDVVRRAKELGLPVTCDVTPHHLGLTDEWIAGSRRWAWEALADDGTERDPWRDGVLTAPPFDSSLRVNPPLRSAADARACLEGLLDGTVDAIATDHAPHTQVDKDVEFGAARPGIAGSETALGIVLELVDAGLLPLERAIEALTEGPMRAFPQPAGRPVSLGLTEGEQADFVVFDRAARWTVSVDTLKTKGFGHPLASRSLPGEVLFTIANGRLAYETDRED
ncbi:MAG TPA: dihydroorotase [Candidatus Limnocylindrales bacterium]|nr:dihydroorotase [Candidatus Limnocylindrales bacterium]